MLGIVLPAHADDEVFGTRGGGALADKAHAIDVTLHRGHAELVVRRTFRNGGTEIDEAIVEIVTPPAAVAVGLRTLGTWHGQPKWFDGELMDADRAARRYRHLTGLDPNVMPKDPVILYWTSPRTLSMQVFPIAPETDKVVEYTFVLPAEYDHGQYQVRLPPLGTAAAPAEYRIRAAAPEDTIAVDGVVVQPGHAVAPKADQPGIDVSLTPASTERLAASFASVSMGRRRVVHLQLAAAPRLSDFPKHAQVVLVLDASRSLELGAAQAQHAAAIAYLHHLRDADVAILHFDRAVRQAEPRFVRSEDAIAELAKGAPDPGNGSAVEVALRRADALLADQPKDLPRRILVLSDLKTRSRLKPETIRKLGLASDALVHVAAVEYGDPELARDDHGPFAALAARTGGVQWTARADRHKALSKEMKRVYEELARPLRIDALRVDGGAYHLRPRGLAEGDGLSRLQIVVGSVRSVQVSGKLWSIPIRKTSRPSAEDNRLWAALATGSELHWELSPREIAQLGRAGRAVTRETSYLAIEPGVRPSSAGFDYTVLEDERETRVPRVRVGSAMMGNGRVFDPDGYLTALLSEAFEDCGDGTDQVDVELETTGTEIVDVARIEVDGSRDAHLRQCLEEATWGVELPFEFEEYERRFFTLNVNW